MTPELRALSERLAALFGDLAVPLVIAAQAGVDTAHMDLSDVVADRWWAVVDRARGENKLAELVEVAKGRLGAHGGAALDKMLRAALDSLPAPAQTPARRTHRDTRAVDVTPEQEIETIRATVLAHEGRIAALEAFRDNERARAASAPAWWFGLIAAAVGIASLIVNLAVQFGVRGP